MDNYATHKHLKIRTWLKTINTLSLKTHSYERIVLHFTPTSSSWLNLVERFFRDFTVDCIRDGSFTSVPDLVRSIESYLTHRNLQPTRYVLKAEGKTILEKI